MSCVLDKLRLLLFKMYLSSVKMPVLGVSNDIADVTDYHTCLLSYGKRFRLERLSGGV